MGGGNVPIKNMLSKPNSGSRSQFGTMLESKKVSAAAYSIGTEQRGKEALVPVSPGPVYVPKPTSKWLGDAPCYSMGTSERGQENKGSKGMPGPDRYNPIISVGPQIESSRLSAPAVGIGTEGRQQHTGKRNPVYTDALFSSVPALGEQLVSSKRTYPSIKIGTDPRFHSVDGESAPGPGNYKSRSSVGKQVHSYCRTLPSRSFGVRHSPKANIAEGDAASIVSPGPAGYRMRDSLGRQISSKAKSSANFSFGSASRFSSKMSVGNPGPGAYTV